MYDCNLIKSRAQKMQDSVLPSLESTYQKLQMPSAPGVPTFPMPVLPANPAVPLIPTVPSAPQTTPAAPRIPTAPSVPQVPSAPVPPQTPSAPVPPQTPSAPVPPPIYPGVPESEQTFMINPLLPRILPTQTSLTVPANPLLPSQFATTLDYESLQYLNGYLRTQIGNYVEAEFLVGSTNIETRFGQLVGVGLNYILIEDVATGDISACDFYNIKFFRTHAHSDLSRAR